MRVVELVALEHVELSEREIPQPGPGEVRIAVHVVGICGTDMDFYSGRRSAGYPFILGHECSGCIDAVGSGVTGFTIGTPVTVRPNFGCGSCDLCKQGRDNICTNSRGLGVTIDGCLAEYILAPARYVWRLPDGMGLEKGALIEPLAVAERAVCRAGNIAGRRVMVLGGGPIGLFALQVAQEYGAEVTLADPLVERLERATGLGAAHVIDVTVEDTVTAGRALTGGQGFDVVIETAGVSETVPIGISLTRPGGRVVLTGLPAEAAIVETRWIVWQELDLVGSFIYEAENFEQASRLLHEGKIEGLGLVTHRFALDQAYEAFDLVARRAGLKVFINVHEEDC